MKIKFNKLTILISAIITVILLNISIKQLKQNIRISTEYPDSFNLSEISTDNVEKILILRSEETISLKKQDDTWIVNEKEEAEVESIENLINKVNSATINKLISTNLENQTNFSVDEENGVIIKFYKSDNNLIEQFIIGDYASNGETYIRKIDGDNVYTLSATLINEISYSYDSWILSEESEGFEITTE